MAKVIMLQFRFRTLKNQRNHTSVLPLNGFMMGEVLKVLSINIFFTSLTTNLMSLNGSFNKNFKGEQQMTTSEQLPSLEF